MKVIILSSSYFAESKSLLEKKTDENTLRSGVISYAVTIIFYEGTNMFKFQDITF